MQFDLKRLPQSQVEITVEVEAREVKKFLPQAAALLSRELNIKGFRPGKAPLALIEQKVGRQQIWEEAVRQGLPHFLSQAIVATKVEVLGRPQMSVQKIAPENSLVFKVVFAVMPAVALGDYQKVRIAKTKVKKAKREDVDKLLHQLVQMRVRLSPVSRPALKGDFVTIDFKTYLKNVPLEGGADKNHGFILGQGQFVSGFEDHLVGMRKGEEKEFTLKVPPDYFQKKMAGRLVRFYVKMQGVQKRVLPAINDHFAQGLGPHFKSLAELKKGLHENLTEEKIARAQEKDELRLLEKICGCAQVEIPSVLIESEKERMLSELGADLKQQGIKFEDYLQSIKKSSEDLKKGWEEQARKRLKTSLILREIARCEKITVTRKEIEQEINSTLRHYQDTPGLRAQLQRPDFHSYIKNILINRKTIRFLAARGLR